MIFQYVNIFYFLRGDKMLLDSKTTGKMGWSRSNNLWHVNFISNNRINFSPVSGYIDHQEVTINTTQDKHGLKIEKKFPSFQKKCGGGGVM